MAQPAANNARSWTDYHPLRFFNLAWEGTKTTPSLPNHQPGIRERIGNALLYGFENAPHVIKKTITNPDLIITVLTVTALWANSRWHYPAQTKELTNTIIKFISEKITWEEAMRIRVFSQWALGCSGIIGLGLRSGGRLATQDYINRLDAHNVQLRQQAVALQAPAPAAPKQ